MYFLERNLENLSLKIIADPIDAYVLVIPLTGESIVTHDQAETALKEVQLMTKVMVEKRKWKDLDAALAIPWKCSSNSI